VDYGKLVTGGGLQRRKKTILSVSEGEEKTSPSEIPLYGDSANAARAVDGTESGDEKKDIK